MNTNFMNRRKGWRGVLLVAAIAASGCGDDLQLVRVDTVPVGDATCPAGGVVIRQGTDSNENGRLDDNEIATSTCADHEVVASSARFPAGDVDCPAGGVALSYGLDNGDGGGTADNGVLEAGEIDDTEKLCDDATLASPVGTDAPAGAAGTNVIRAAGGNSVAGQAGNGGTIAINGGYNGVNQVAVFRTGTYSRAVALPATDADLGGAPINVTANRTIGNLPVVDPVPDGLYYDTATNTVVSYTGNVRTTGTGLHVAPGVTATFNNQADNILEIVFSDDVHLEGTIAMGTGDATADAVSIRADDFWAAEGSTINLVNGAVASSLTVQARRIASGADVIASGTGAPGSVQLRATADLVNLGDIDVSGADGAATAAGSVILLSDANLANAGNLMAVGGGGASATGYAGGAISITSGNTYGGELVNTGDLDASGGTVTAAASTGGNGATITLSANGGALISTGDLISLGGNGVAQGGAGGAVIAQINPGTSYAPAAMRFDGSVDVMGGSGDAGGPGGTISLGSGSYGVEAMAFYGVERVTSDGGDSTGGLGGNAGSLTVNASSPFFTLSTGAIVLRTALSFAGGNGGGDAGSISLNNQTYVDIYGTLSPVVPGAIVEGEVDLRGADDDNAAGGNGGSFTLTTSRAVSIVGSILSYGGHSLDDSGNGGAGGAISLNTLQGDMSITGNLDTSGGDGATGGAASTCYITSSHSVVTGNIYAVGGDGSATGGAGGTVQFFSTSTAGDVTGVVDVSGGAGPAVGADGTIVGTY